MKYLTAILLSVCILDRINRSFSPLVLLLNVYIYKPLIEYENYYFTTVNLRAFQLLRQGR